MKVFHRFLLILIAAVAGFAFSGCFLLMLGSLGYTGYQYHEKEGVFAPGQPLGGPAPDDKTQKASNSSKSSPPAAPANSDIE